MKAVVQRCSMAKVTVDNSIVGQIGQGLLVFVGAGRDDNRNDLEYIADKIIGLRIFSDDTGKMTNSVVDLNASILVVSQFTLFGDVRKGRRPSFDGAMPPDQARPFLDDFVARIRAANINVQTGQFGADMKVELLNDGPVTILLDSRAK